MLESDGLGLRLRCSTNLNDLVAGKLQLGNVHSITSHQVTIENSEHGLVSNDQEIIVLAFELEDNRLKADSEIMV
jgi:hypothetical protein